VIHPWVSSLPNAPFDLERYQSIQDSLPMHRANLRTHMDPFCHKNLTHLCVVGGIENIRKIDHYLDRHIANNSLTNTKLDLAIVDRKQLQDALIPN
jgi:hypothetical protein